MLVPFEPGAEQLQLARAIHELEACNPLVRRYGLSLSAEDIQALVVGRVEALSLAERVEFGSGVTKQLVVAFASSQYVSQTNFAETILELQDLFYEFKNESLEQVPDDDLITTMRALFDGVAGGDVEFLAEALFEGLGRRVREETVTGDSADPNADTAVMNAYTLAASRYDVSKWVDDKYAPPWEGASWLDE